MFPKILEAVQCLHTVTHKLDQVWMEDSLARFGIILAGAASIPSVMTARTASSLFLARLSLVRAGTFLKNPNQLDRNQGGR